MENQQQQPQNNLCRANCGFYGSPATEDYCSKCFKDMIARKQETGTGSNVQRHSSPISASTGSTTEITSASTSDTIDLAQLVGSTKTEDDNCGTPARDDQTSASKEETPKKKNRCHVCNKRVGLTGFDCRCGGLYCGEHRYDTAHNCTFDYKTMGREELRKNNPQVISEKIQRI